MSTLMHRDARDVDQRWIGLTVTATDVYGATRTGGLSDVTQRPTHGRTVLYMGGHIVDVRQSDTVTVDTLGGQALGGRP